MSSAASRCTLCHNLEHIELDSRLTFAFTPSELADSVSNSGCEPCAIILKGLQLKASEWDLETEVESIHATCHQRRGPRYDSLSLEVYFVDNSRPRLDLEVFCLDPPRWGAIELRPTVSNHPLSPQGIAWVRSLLGECWAQHRACNQNEIACLPRRVLELKSISNNEITVTLLETHDLHAKYVALSHRWGNHRTCITTKANIEERRNGIPWRDIPQTFKDAATFAVQLNYSYLWIDSLCIVQDDATDWEIESPKMSEIYRYAALTIAATGAESDSEGCFPQQPRPGHSEIIIDIGSDNRPRIAIREALKHWDDLTRYEINKTFPLLSRAWAYQERLLSRRMLHFGKDELVWECRQLSECECGHSIDTTSPCGDYYNVVKASEQQTAIDQQGDLDFQLARKLMLEEQDDDDLKKEIAPFITGTQAEDSRNESTSIQLAKQCITLLNFTTKEDFVGSVERNMVAHFHRLLESYTQLSLTKTSDRLPAFSGLCQRVKSLRGEYCAGLWYDTMAMDLSWHVDNAVNDESGTGRPVQYLGPTWSWVSVNSPVNYWKDEAYSNLASLRMKARVEVIGQNPFGKIKSAALRIDSGYTVAFLTYQPGGGAEEVRTRYNLTASLFQTHISFWPDHIAIAGKPTEMEPTKVVLLQIQPHIAVVLRELHREGVVKRSQKTWERIGITRFEDTHESDILSYRWIRGWFTIV
ncbi:hypothetical protein ACN47E_003501 [Coniothyrium glycines]